MSCIIACSRFRRRARRLVHHRRDVGRAGGHQFHGLRHGFRQRLVVGERLDLLLPQIDVLFCKLLQIGPLRVIAIRLVIVAHGFVMLFIRLSIRLAPRHRHAPGCSIRRSISWPRASANVALRLRMHHL